MNQTVFPQNPTASKARSSPADAELVHSLDLVIGGMTCASCVGRVERALRKVPGLSLIHI